MNFCISCLSFLDKFTSSRYYFEFINKHYYAASLDGFMSSVKDFKFIKKYPFNSLLNGLIGACFVYYFNSFMCLFVPPDFVFYYYFLFIYGIIMLRNGQRTSVIHVKRIDYKTYLFKFNCTEEEINSLY